MSESTARVLRDVLREMAAPSIAPKPAPIRRGPLYWFTYAIEDMTGWSLEVGYRTDQEPGDRVEIDIVEVRQYTPAGYVNLGPDSLGENRERIEDLIREDVEKRLEAERDDRDTRWERSR